MIKMAAMKGDLTTLQQFYISGLDVIGVVDLVSMSVDDQQKYSYNMSHTTHVFKMILIFVVITSLKEIIGILYFSRDHRK